MVLGCLDYYWAGGEDNKDGVKATSTWIKDLNVINESIEAL